jgi:hypothetical protein
MITLSLQEIQFMLMTLSLPTHLKSELARLRYEGNKSISDDMADELRDLCTERLDTHGFDASYAPTEEGKTLEALIDKLFLG